MKTALKRTAACALSCLLLFLLCAGAAADGTPADRASGERSYTITSPYDGVNWETDKQYKASLHSHTNASDGVPSIAESVKEHYDLGFQILAITDHAVLGVPWDETPQMVPIYRLFKFSNTGMKDPEILTSQERAEIINGTYESERRNAAAASRGEELGGMMEITGACEANGATPINDCHINTFGCKSVQAKMGVYGDYETVARACENEGGLSFLDHTGEYTGSWFPQDDERARVPYYANKYANIFLTYKSCVAFDIDPERNDYVTWDEVLKLTVPKGRNVPCITFSDAHNMDNLDYDRSFVMMIMPEKTQEAFRECMETGAWFSISRRCSELGAELDGTGKVVPEVHSINVNKEDNVISFTGAKYSYVKWLSGGRVIAEGENLTSIDLNDYEDELDCYVRFQVYGEGGILYSQPFVTMADGVEYTSHVYKTFDLPMFFRAFVDALNLLLGWTPIVLLVRGLLWGRVWWF